MGTPLDPEVAQALAIMEARFEGYRRGKADGLAEAAQRQQMQCVPCNWCGSPRPAGGRFCPHCRLDLNGCSADKGGFNFNNG